MVEKKVIKGDYYKRKKAAKQWLDDFLSKGGTMNYWELLNKFEDDFMLGKKTVDAFLKLLGKIGKLTIKDEVVKGTKVKEEPALQPEPVPDKEEVEHEAEMQDVRPNDEVEGFAASESPEHTNTDSFGNDEIQDNPQ